MGRYNDISRGPELKAAYDKYQLWLAKERSEKQTAYEGASKGERVKIPRVSAYLQPFGNDADVWIEVLAPQKGATGEGSDLINTAYGFAGTRLKADAPTVAGTLILPRDQFKGFKPAKITIKRVKTRATAKTASRITGNRYLHHESNSLSVPFGRLSATDSFSDAVKAIKGSDDYTAFIGQQVGNSVRFTPEA